MKNDQDIYMIVIPNNTGFASDDQSVHEEEARKIIQRRLDYASKLETILLVPAFPRPEKYQGEIYTHALDRGAITTDVPELRRIDLQLIAMINDARKKLLFRGIETEEKVFMLGFSASGMFVNRFTILHPESVQAASIGSPGGWPTVPTGKIQGKDVNYPYGVNDIERLTGEEFNIEAFRLLPLFFFMGDEDTNECVPPPGIRTEEQRFIFQEIGGDPIERWPVAQETYDLVGCNSQFVLYPGVGHIITNEMLEDIQSFFLRNCEAP